MIGIAFGYPTDDEMRLWELPYELRFARIEVGDSFVSTNGRTIGPYYWRKWEQLSLEERNTLAKEILDITGNRSQEITGFTLFYQSSVYTKADGTKTDGPGFQMSIRRKGEEAWSVTIIPEEEAMKVFRLLESKADGPWTLIDDRSADLRDSYIVPQSAVEGWPKKEPPEEEEFFDPAQEDDLLSLLRAAAEAVERRNEVLATLIAGEP